MQDALEARAFLSETHHMSNIYFMMVDSYFYMIFSQFLGYFSLFLLLLLFYRHYRVVESVRAFFWS